MDKFKKQLIEDWKFYGLVCMRHIKVFHKKHNYSKLVDIGRLYNDFIEDYSTWLMQTRNRVKSKVCSITFNI